MLLAAWHFPPVGYIELLQPAAPCKKTLRTRSFFWVLAQWHFMTFLSEMGSLSVSTSSRNWLGWFKMLQNGSNMPLLDSLHHFEDKVFGLSVAVPLIWPLDQHRCKGGIVWVSQHSHYEHCLSDHATNSFNIQYNQLWYRRLLRVYKEIPTHNFQTFVQNNMPLSVLEGGVRNSGWAIQLRNPTGKLSPYAKDYCSLISLRSSMFSCDSQTSFVMLLCKTATVMRCANGWVHFVQDWRLSDFRSTRCWSGIWYCARPWRLTLLKFDSFPNRPWVDFAQTPHLLSHS